MAQEKLLHILIMIIVSFPAIASPKVQASQEDKSWARDLAKSATGLAMSEIKQKYIELQRMLAAGEGRGIDLDGSEENLFVPTPILRVFVSSSMNKQLLKSYMEEAKTYKAVLVFKGLPGGSWHKLSQLVTEITGNNDEEVAIQIDDEAFGHFGITSVPSFVLSQENERWTEGEASEVNDKVIGNVGIKGALRLIAEKGDLKIIAGQMLKEAGGYR